MRPKIFCALRKNLDSLVAMTSAAAPSEVAPDGLSGPLSEPAPGALETSHRERKKLATRQAIHEAAFELVDESGLAHVTIEAVSERAGVAPRTFWAYFGSKEDAVLKRDPDRPRSLRQALLARPAGEDPVS